MEEVITEFELEDSYRGGWELETTSIFDFGIINILGLISASEYYFYENTLVGISFAFYDDFPIYYGMEERNSYETNKQIYNYVRDAINTRYGKGLEIDNRLIDSDEIKNMSEMIILGSMDPKTIKEISITTWKINDTDSLFLKLILDDEGCSRNYLLFGNLFFQDKYKQILEKEISEMEM